MKCTVVLEYDIEIPDEVDPSIVLVDKYMRDVNPNPTRQRFNFVKENKPMVIVPNSLHG